MQGRNSPARAHDLLGEYLKHGKFKEALKERSPRMTLEEMGLEHLAPKDPRPDRKLRTVVVGGMSPIPTPDSNDDD